MTKLDQIKQSLGLQNTTLNSMNQPDGHMLESFMKQKMALVAYGADRSISVLTYHN